MLFFRSLHCTAGNSMTSSGNPLRNHFQKKKRPQPYWGGENSGNALEPSNALNYRVWGIPAVLSRGIPGKTLRAFQPFRPKPCSRDGYQPPPPTPVARIQSQCESKVWTLNLLDGTYLHPARAASTRWKPLPHAKKLQRRRVLLHRYLHTQHPSDQLSIW